MANAPWLSGAVAAAKTAAEQLGLLIDVTITRHGGESVVAKALIEAVDVREIGLRSTVDDARHVLTLYGDKAETGDFITWGGEHHEVLEVRGIAKDANGSGYQTQVVAN